MISVNLKITVSSCFVIFLKLIIKKIDKEGVSNYHVNYKSDLLTRIWGALGKPEQANFEHEIKFPLEFLLKLTPITTAMHSYYELPNLGAGQSW